MVVCNRRSCIRVGKRARTERLSARVTWQSADGTSIEISPVGQVSSGCTHETQAERHFVRQFLLNSEVVRMIHWCPEIANNLDDTWWRGGSRVCPENWNARR